MTATHKNTNTAKIWTNIVLISLVVVSSLLSNLVSVSQYTILFELTFIFYFHLIVPNAFPLWGVFSYGLLKDILCIEMFGYYALLFTSFKFALDLQEFDIAISSKLSSWMRFSITLFAVCLLQIGLINLAFKYNFYKVLQYWLGSWMITSFAYPILAYIYQKSLQITGYEYDLQ